LELRVRLGEKQVMEFVGRAVISGNKRTSDGHAARSLGRHHATMRNGTKLMVPPTTLPAK